MKEFDLIKSPLDRTINCLEASAGTGKTYALTWIYLRLLLEEKVPASEILVVTFTKAATAELRDRTRKRLVEALEAATSGKGSDESLLEYFKVQSAEAKKDAANLLKNALEIFDLVSIYTIDSFCQRTLRDAALESSVLFDMELIPNQDEYIREAAADYCRRNLFSQEPVLASAAIHSRLDPEDMAKALRNYAKHSELRLVAASQPRKADLVDAAVVAAFNAVAGQWPVLGGAEQLADFFATVDKSTWAKDGYKRSKALKNAGCIAACLEKGEWPSEFWPAVEYFSLSSIESQVRIRQQMPVNLPAAKAFFKACETLSVLMAEHRTAHRFEFLASARKALAEKKQRYKQASFSDQISRLKEALEGSSGKALAKTIRGRYQAALIDESQDTDPRQWEIFRTIFADESGSHWLYLIGDPKQAIYRFRGADVHTYLKAAGTTDAMHRFTLGTNWRSESRLVRAVNAVFSGSAEKVPFPVFLENGIQFKPVDPSSKADSAPIQFPREAHQRPAPLQVWKWEPTDDFVTKDDAKKRLPLAVAAEIGRLLSTGVELGVDTGKRALQPRDIAVLVESHAQANWIQQALHDLEIPSVEKATESVFKSDEAREMQWILQAILTPGREAGVKAALTTDAMGFSGNELSQIVTDESSWQEQLQKFTRYRKVWDEDGFYTMFREFIRKEQVAESFLRFPNAERRLTNFMHIAEVMEKTRKAEHLGPTRLLQWLELRRHGEGEVPEDHQLRLESDEDAVQIVTMHSSKGLEYPVVFCPFILQSAVSKNYKDQVVFHDENGDLCWDIDEEPVAQNIIRSNKETLADKVRLLYVALTRARNRCYLVSARYTFLKKNNATSLAWVLQRKCSLPADPVGELRDLKPDWSAPWDEIKALADSRCNDGEAIAIAEVPPAQRGQNWIREAKPHAAIEARKCGRNEIKPSWYLTSFTGISSKIAADEAEARSATAHPNDEDVLMPDRDSVSGGLKEAIAGSAQPASGIFALPAGVRTGDCLHKILEQYDFQNPEETKTRQLIRQHLESAGIPVAEHEEAVQKMLGRIRSLQFKHGDGLFTLAVVPAKERLVELEFHFPAAAIHGQQLMEAIRGRTRDGARAAAPGIRPLSAFMKGFIDLVFSFQGRFHIVDWKSNLLGLSTADYHQEALKEKIQEEYYDLQYHLYTVALDKFLRQRLRDYDYEKHFGGVHYVFLRGLDAAQPETGMFHDRPAKATIENLSQLLQPGMA